MRRGRRIMTHGSLVTATVVSVASIAGACLTQAHGQAAVAEPGSPPPVQASLSDVSCPTAKLCLAAGGSQRLNGLNSPFSQIWNGTSWRTLATPQRQPDSSLAAAACARPPWCYAVGNDQHTGVPFADYWNGAAWRLMPAFKLPLHATLAGLSCPAPGSCIAVGTGRTSFAALGALAEYWNGRTWTRMQTVDPPGATSSSFAAISCVPTVHQQCVAVGQYYTGTGINQVAHALVEALTEGVWSLQPAPPGPDGLAGVSCPTSTTCMAVGGGLFAATWNGHTWTPLAVANPGSPFPGLLAVSCASATTCMTLGGDNETGMYSQSWTGGASLTLLSIPNPAHAPRGLSALSCPRASRCLAVGSIASLGSPTTIPLAQWWNGTTWRSARTQHADGLASVSCPTATTCLAVGTYINKADNNQTMAQAWNATVPRRVRPPGRLGALTDISCTNPSFCMATGGAFSGFLVELWNGSGWKPAASPEALSRVSCVKRSFCLAVGAQYGSPSEKWNGTTWHVAAKFVTAGTTTAIADLSCISRTYCMAVGSYTTDPHGEVNVPLAETWNGARWKWLRAPALGENAAFNAVSCVRGSGCMAVGNYQDIKNAGHNMAARWNGSHWRAFRLPGGFGYGGGLINGLSGPTDVSCPTLSSCMAVGNYYDAGNGIVYDLAIAWNGISWTLTPTSRPGGGLADVSCPRPGQCVAVGQVGTRTLAERWNGATWSRLGSANP